MAVDHRRSDAKFWLLGRPRPRHSHDQFGMVLNGRFLNNAHEINSISSRHLAPPKPLVAIHAHGFGVFGL